MFSGKEIFASLRKDLEDGSLQFGKDYWELEDWNKAFPISVETSKRWTKEIIEEKNGSVHSTKWNTISRRGHHKIVWRLKLKWMWSSNCRYDGQEQCTKWRSEKSKKGHEIQLVRMCEVSTEK